MNDPEVVLCLDVQDIAAAIAWWDALAGFRVVANRLPDMIGHRARLRSPRVPSLELELHSTWPRPTTGCTIGSVRSITIHLDDPHAAVAALVAKLGPEAVIEVDRSESAVTLRDSSGYLICVSVHRPEGFACTDATHP